ncbi:MAG: ribonuclease H-like domain-containing protein [candidate division NC10 bacterium]
MTTGARILYIDIETAPNLAHVWGHWEQNVIAHQREWTMLCFAWQWEGEKKIHVASNWHDHGEILDDTKITQTAWDLLDEADIVIAHNGDKFDIRKLNARFVRLGMLPPSPYRTVDTTKVARRYFAFNSNSLDNLGETLGLGRKVKHPGWEMWEGCLAGEQKWWDLMVRYNRQDITLLRKVYLRLRPFMSNHPNLAAYDTLAVCPTCGKGISAAQKRGLYYNQTTNYQQWRCMPEKGGCGTWYRSRVREPESFSPATTSVTRR